MPDPTWLPTPAELHALILTRAVGDDGAGADAFGAPLPAFTANTAVTLDQATSAISLAARVPHSITGESIDATLGELAAEATLCKAASRVEAAVLAGHTSQGDTASAYWLKQYEQALAELRTYASNVSSGDEPGPDDNVGSGRVSSWFPATRLRDSDGLPKVV